MPAVDPKSFQPGQELVTHLYNQAGVKLLSSGAILTRELCEAIRNASSGPLFLAASASEVVRETTKGVAELSDELLLLRDLGALRPTNDRWRSRLGLDEGLLDRRATTISTDESERWLHARSLWYPRIRRASEIVAERTPFWDRLPRRLTRGVDPIVLTPDASSAWPRGAKLAALRDERVRAHREFLHRLMTAEAADIEETQGLVDELILLYRRHAERFTQLALLAPARADFLPDHGYTRCVLSIAIAARLELSVRDVRLAGLTGALCDVGMSLLPIDLRIAERPLDDVEINRVRRHPNMSVIMLDTLRGVPEDVLLATTQHHERLDGSGYPNALRGESICDLARIVGLADVFAAAVAPRPYKPSKLPHHALAELIRLAESGVFDRADVSALVRATGLFPAGSAVRLNSGERAQVVSCDPRRPDRPKVEILEPTATEAFIPTRRVIDLGSEDHADTRVIGPVQLPPLKQG